MLWCAVRRGRPRQGGDAVRTTLERRRLRRRHWLRTLVAAAALALIVGCGSSDSGGDNQKAAGASAGDRTTVTTWTRAATQIATKRLAAGYTGSHKNQVKVTVIP